MTLADMGEKAGLPIYPIEQVARSTQTRFQLGFAKMATYCLPRFEDAALDPTAEGLRILGANEMALAAPRDMLRKFHRSGVALCEPRVRLLHHRQQVREPVMCVRACVDENCVEGVLHDLVKRDAAIDSVNWLHTPVIVRASARLRHLLGYPEDFAVLTNRSGELKMWLSHYVPITPDPDNLAA